MIAVRRGRADGWTRTIRTRRSKVCDGLVIGVTGAMFVLVVASSIYRYLYRKRDG